jgi:hypothetical protein
MMNDQSTATKRPGLIEALNAKAKWIIGGCAVVLITIFFLNHSEDQKAAADRLKPDATTYWQDFQKAAAPCDDAGMKATATSMLTDPVATYDALNQAKDICESASRAANRLITPKGATGEVKTAFDDANAACGYAFSLKSDAYASLAKVANGDVSPAAQSAARNQADDSKQQVTRCINLMTKAVQDAGGEIPGLTK